MRIPELNFQVIGAVTADYPVLDGIIDCETHFNSLSPMHIGFVAIVHLKEGCWETLQARCTGNHPKGKTYSTVAAILDDYCSNEVEKDFTLGGHDWLIGDGDDSLAVRERDSHSAEVWVRTFL